MNCDIVGNDMLGLASIFGIVQVCWSEGLVTI